jgi:hypothetical protein
MLLVFVLNSPPCLAGSLVAIKKVYVPVGLTIVALPKEVFNLIFSCPSSLSPHKRRLERDADVDLKLEIPNPKSKSQHSHMIGLLHITKVKSRTTFFNPLGTPCHYLLPELGRIHRLCLIVRMGQF